jgi:cyclophilin family peptidyl-prolyl cis-trans isomerase/HEAT repeat protein
MKPMTLFLSSLLSFTLFFSCTDAVKNASNKFSNEEYVKLYQAADQRDAQTVLEFFKHDSADFRRDAAYLAANIQDTILLRPLFDLVFKDSIEEVRAAAAHAMGYFEETSALISPLIDIYKKEKSTTVQRELLISMGKTYSQSSQNAKQVFFGGFVQTYYNKDDYGNFMLRDVKFTDSDIRYGFVTAMLQLNSRGLQSDELMDRLPYLLQDSDSPTRVNGSQAMARATTEWLNNNKKYIFRWVEIERDTDVKNALITAVSKIDDPKSDQFLLGFIGGVQSDSQNAISALQGIERRGKADVFDLLPILKHQDSKVVNTALQAISILKFNESLDAINVACNDRNDEIKALVAKLNIIAGKDADGARCMNLINSATNDYSKSFYIHALAATDGRIEDLTNMLKDPSPIVKYAAAESIVELYSKNNKPGKSIAQIAQIGFETMDIGVIDLFSTYLARNLPSDSDAMLLDPIMDAALKSMKMPRDIEAYNHLVEAINSIGTRKVELAKPDFSSKIDWAFVSTISKYQVVAFETNKGTFKMQLNVERTPGSVANIVKLVNDGFYNGKSFHRIVPNFVAQGGCPIGTGMGGTDFPIRSEFTDLRYERGTVGLASSGKDTESCQWFITYLPQPRLDGRYTIIGTVTEGMEVVDEIAIGDKIISAKLIEN